MFLLILGTILLGFLSLCWWYIEDQRRYSGFPPGPPRIPFLGSLLFIPSSPYPSIAFQQLSERYGDVIHIKMGMVNAVAFNSYDSVKEILNHEKAFGRSNLAMIFQARNWYKNLGIAFGNDETWRTLRGFTLRSLREFGFGKASSMDIVINQELQKVISNLKSDIDQNPAGESVQHRADDMFSVSMINILMRLVTGINYEEGNAKIRRFLEISERFSKSSNFAMDTTIAFPPLWHLFPRWFGKNVQMKLVQELHEFARETIREHRESGVYRQDPQCYVDAFLAKIDETQGDPQSLYTAGAETSSKSMSFAMLYILLNPHVQEKVQKEIDSEIEENEDITWSMKTRIPYTFATVMESLRWSVVAPFTPPRMATEDFHFKGHLIKKGTTLLVNIQAANFSQTEWTEPTKFLPERFLSAEGQLDTKAISRLVTFGDGKRVCVGQSVAEKSIFIYFATLLRTFNVRVVGDEVPSHLPKSGMTYSPQPFKIRFVPR